MDAVPQELLSIVGSTEIAYALFEEHYDMQRGAVDDALCMLHMVMPDMALTNGHILTFIVSVCFVQCVWRQAGQ